MRDMLGRGVAMDVDAALARLLGALPAKEPPMEHVSLVDATSRICAADILCPEDLPGFNRSTVDGYALAARDSFGASETSPAYITISHDIPMGEMPDFMLASGTVARIATGGMLPEGADSVLMLEHATEASAGLLEVQRTLAPGDNVIKRGEDAARGTLLIPQGRGLRAQDIAVLAGIGMREAHVFARPRVAVISTGDELISPSSEATPGKVRDMNSYNLNSLLLADGAAPMLMGIVPDTQEALGAALKKALDEGADMVLISGGSSVGTRDVTQRVMAACGQCLFHGVALRPGKPLIAAVTERGVPMFGLPGHPRAVSVCYALFVRAALGRLAGRAEADELTAEAGCVRARLLRAVPSTAGRRDEISVSLKRIDGELWAMPIMAKSGLMTTLLNAHGTLSIPSHVLGHGAQETVTVKLH